MPTGIFASSPWPNMAAIRINIRTISPQLLWLCAGINLAVLPHYSRIPLWIYLLFITLSLWRLILPMAGHQRQGSTLVPMLGKLLIGTVIITGILISYGTLVGRDASVALLISLAGLKFLETHQQRDLYVSVFIGFFIVLTGFLYSQSIPMAIYMLIVVVFLTAVLISFNDPENSLSTRARLVTAGVIVLQSIPLMLVVFVLFPRVPGPLWGLPRDADRGLAGISDEMAPGSISQLTLSDQIAFRVKFAGAVPDQSLRYWRGPVLWQTDGVKWTQDRPRRSANLVTYGGAAVEYTVTLEATNQYWLFGLEMPVKPPEDAIFTHDMQIRTRMPVRNITRYSLVSHTDYKYDLSDPAELSRALQLPQGYHPRAIALGKSWGDAGLTDQQIAGRALQMFNARDFYYTLNPPQYLQDTVDEFLFDSRRGFCEHYAAAFVVLMRAAGIPARVVTGYQGGMLNNIDNYLVVRQRDAHAWAEIWLAGHGWTRVDPTSAVSPARISEGIENALPDSIIDVPLGLRQSAMIRNLWRQIRNTYEAINNGWNQWVLSYDTKRQRSFLIRFGMKDVDWKGMTLWLVFATGTMFALVSLWLFRHPGKNGDPVQELYDIFCAKLAKVGIRRRISEGPRDFAERAGRLRTDLQRTVAEITGLYIAVRYAGKIQALDALRHQVRTFRPARIKTG